jgi:hypothetical protein
MCRVRLGKCVNWERGRVIQRTLESAAHPSINGEVTAKTGADSDLRVGGSGSGSASDTAGNNAIDNGSAGEGSEAQDGERSQRRRRETHDWKECGWWGTSGKGGRL